MFQAIENGSLLIGPAIAGVIILMLGPLAALWLETRVDSSCQRFLSSNS